MKAVGERLELFELTVAAYYAVQEYSESPIRKPSSSHPSFLFNGEAASRLWIGEHENCGNKKTEHTNSVGR